MFTNNGRSSIAPSSTPSTIIGREKNEIFQDPPLIDRSIRLSVIETRNSDKQIINELVYRWCRIITRVSLRTLNKIASGPSDSALKDQRRVLIVDLVGFMSPVRLATVLKRDERRLQMLGTIRSCKINSTYVTLHTYLSRQETTNALKLVVIYQDEFFILKTLTLLKDFLQFSKAHVLLVVPRLDRQEQDFMSLISNYQILRCGFCVNRRDIGPAPPDATNDSYQSYLNQIYFQRYASKKGLPDRVQGELMEDGLYLHGLKTSTKPDDQDANKRLAPVNKKLKPSDICGSTPKIVEDKLN